MWTCPHCKHYFKEVNQNHFCKTIPTNIEDYINRTPEEYRTILQYVCEIVRKYAPNSIEKIIRNMPTFCHYDELQKQSEQILIQFNITKNYLELHLCDETVRYFEARLIDNLCKYSRGIVQIPWNNPMPFKLIWYLILFRINEVIEISI